jgi:hypothetical protein
MSRPAVSLALSLALVACSSADPAEAFLARAEECRHWAGEEPFDAERGAEIARNIERLRCQALPTDAAKLKAQRPEEASRLNAALEWM